MANAEMHIEVDKIIEPIVEKAAAAAARSTLYEFRKERLLKNGLDPYKKAEILLYDYNDYVAAIEEKERQILFVQQFGIPQKSKSITSYSANNGTMTVEERQEAYIKDLEKSRAITQYFIDTIDGVLEKLESEKYYDIIPMTYFEKKTREEIAEYYGTDVGTISRNKKKLIKKIQIKLFSDEVILNLIAG